MPLSKKRDKARKRLERARGAVQPNFNPSDVQPVQPNEPLLDAISPSVQREDYGKVSISVQPNKLASTSKAEKLTMLRELIDNPGALKSSPVKEEGIPLYNPRVHKPGDKVRMTGPTGKITEVIVPEVDAEGYSVPEL